MLQPPPLTKVPRYPVTAGVAIASILVTGLWWANKDVGPFFMTGEVWSKLQLWRAVTSVLPHVNFFHLAFNIYWLWVFGTLLEEVYGHLRFAGIVLLLAVGSSLGEFMLLDGGVGLSGVGYGLFGMLWALQRYDSRFSDAIDNRTIELFVIWFFVCIALTAAKVMMVANVAHGVGAILGGLLGVIACHTGKLRLQGIVVLVALMVALVLGSTVFWPQVNLTSDPRDEMARAGVDALFAKDYAQGRRFLEQCVRMKGAPASAWYNLGVACERLQDYDQALVAFEHAADMPDATPNMISAAASTRQNVAARKFLETNNVGTGVH